LIGNVALVVEGGSLAVVIPSTLYDRIGYVIVFVAVWLSWWFIVNLED